MLMQSGLVDEQYGFILLLIRSGGVGFMKGLKAARKFMPLSEETL